MKWPHKEGSILITVLCVTSVVSLLALKVWRNTLFALETARERGQYMQLLKATEGLLHIAVALGQENYEIVVSDPTGIEVLFPQWLILQQTIYEGKIYVRGHKEHMGLQAVIQTADRVACSLHCSLHQESPKRYRITNWTIDSVV